MKEDKLLSLSPIERKVLPLIELGSLKEVIEKSGLDETTIKRALQFLATKNLVQTKKQSQKIIDLGVNGIHYKKNGLPERKLIEFILEKPEVSLDQAKQQSGLSENEFMIALGVLKEKDLIKLESGKLTLNKNKEDLIKKFPEEKFLEALPKPLDQLKDQLTIIEKLKKRKNILIIEEKEELSFELTNEGKELAKSLQTFKQELLEQLTPELIKTKKWKGKKFRHYDVSSKVPMIFGGKKHPYLKFLDEVRKELTSLGFEEAQGNLVENSFFNCDALFMPQNHPARGIHDLYFI
jgi:phenylalanyl-tRNA synthetase alpha chain